MNNCTFDNLDKKNTSEIRTELHKLVRNNTTHRLARLIKHCADQTLINKPNRKGRTLIYESKSLKVFRCLVDAGANCSVTDADGNTLIHRFVRTNRFLIVKDLIQLLGIEFLNKTNNKGFTPIFYVKTYQMFTLLLKAGALWQKCENQPFLLLQKLSTSTDKTREVHKIFQHVMCTENNIPQHSLQATFEDYLNWNKDIHHFRVFFYEFASQKKLFDEKLYDKDLLKDIIFTSLDKQLNLLIINLDKKGLIPHNTFFHEILLNVALIVGDKQWYTHLIEREFGVQNPHIVVQNDEYFHVITRAIRRFIALIPPTSKKEASHVLNELIEIKKLIVGGVNPFKFFWQRPILLDALFKNCDLNILINKVKDIEFTYEDFFIELFDEKYSSINDGYFDNLTPSIAFKKGNWGLYKQLIDLGYRKEDRTAKEKKAFKKILRVISHFASLSSSPNFNKAARVLEDILDLPSNASKFLDFKNFFKWNLPVLSALYGQWDKKILKSEINYRNKNVIHIVLLMYRNKYLLDDPVINRLVSLAALQTHKWKIYNRQAAKGYGIKKLQNLMILNDYFSSYAAQIIHRFTFLSLSTQTLDDDNVLELFDFLINTWHMFSDYGDPIQLLYTNEHAIALCLIALNYSDSIYEFIYHRGGSAMIISLFKNKFIPFEHSYLPILSFAAMVTKDWDLYTCLAEKGYGIARLELLMDQDSF